MSEENEYLDEAKILLKAERNLGRKLTDNEIRKLMHIPKPKGTIIRTRYGLLPKGHKDPLTGKETEEID